MSAQHLPPETLNDWLTAASAELGLDEEQTPIGLILEVAAEVAHGVARPAAPLSTFLLGLALGNSAGEESLESLAQRLSELARSWNETRGEDTEA